MKKPGGWSLWLHPRRYAALWNEREEELALLRDLLLRSETERERLVEAALAQSQGEEERENMRREYEKEIAGLNEKVVGLELRLKEWEATEIELKEIEKQLEKFTEQKERYEARIKELKGKLREQSDLLREARILKARNEEQESEEADLKEGERFDMLNAKPVVPRKSRRPARPADDTDWLMELDL